MFKYAAIALLGATAFAGECADDLTAICAWAAEDANTASATTDALCLGATDAETTAAICDTWAATTAGVADLEGDAADAARAQADGLLADATSAGVEAGEWLSAWDTADDAAEGEGDAAEGDDAAADGADGEEGEEGDAGLRLASSAAALALGAMMLQ